MDYDWEKKMFSGAVQHHLIKSGFFNDIDEKRITYNDKIFIEDIITCTIINVSKKYEFNNKKMMKEIFHELVNYSYWRINR